MADRPCNSKQEKNSSVWQLKHHAFILTLIPTTQRCVRMRRCMYVPVCVWGKKYLWHYFKCFVGLRWLLIFNLGFFLLCKRTGDPREIKNKDFINIITVSPSFEIKWRQLQIFFLRRRPQDSHKTFLEAHKKLHLMSQIVLGCSHISFNMSSNTFHQINT